MPQGGSIVTRKRIFVAFYILRQLPQLSTACPFSLLSHRKKPQPVTHWTVFGSLPAFLWSVDSAFVPCWGTSLGQDSFLYLRGILRSMTMAPLTSSHLPKLSQRSVPSQYSLPVSYRRYSCMVTPGSHVDCFTLLIGTWRFGPKAWFRLGRGGLGKPALLLGQLPVPKLETHS